MNLDNLVREAYQLRLAGDFSSSYELARSYEESNSFFPAWTFNPIFWKKLKFGKVILSRRNINHSDFLRSVWSSSDFMDAFNYLAPALPQSSAELKKILHEEYFGTIDQSNELHYVVCDSDEKPWGLLSLMDISLQHKKSEVLLGVLPGAPHGIAPAAMFALFKFYFSILKFNKLYSYVRSDNSHSLKGTLHLGFRVEGNLREELFNNKSKTYYDLIRTGILKEEALASLNSKIARKLIGS
jgi:RimJ/RimL family protein N-acetyltransferase